jgi:DNA-directed RNA polymerase specialized sigma24 family protein
MDGDKGPMAATASALSSPVLGETLATETRDERFSAFVVSHRERARRLAWRLVGGDEDAAEDVCQDAFAKAYRALDRFRGDSRIETWFYRILVRQAHNHRRWRAVRERWGAAWDGEPPDPSPVGPGDPGLRRRIARASPSASARRCSASRPAR